MLKNGRAYAYGHTIQTAIVNPEAEKHFFSAENVKSLSQLRIHLCHGFNSHCAECECLDACKFGQKWREYGYAVPKNTQTREKKKPINRDGQTWKKYYYTEREEKHLCVSCGQPLEEKETHVACERCRRMERLKKNARRAMLAGV